MTETIKSAGSITGYTIVNEGLDGSPIAVFAVFAGADMRIGINTNKGTQHE